MAEAFTRSGSQLRAELDSFERTMLRQLSEELADLLAAAADEADVDPLARQLGLQDLAAGPAAAPEDPVLRRLLPDGYREDQGAATDFRRFTERALRDGKCADARLMHELMDRAEPDGELILTEAEAQALMRALNDLRLALATRLGVTSERSYRQLAALPDDDPRSAQFAVYDFLTWLQESLIAALTS